MPTSLPPSQENLSETQYSKQVIREVLRGWDPEGLIEMGAPKDEYEPEVEQVSDRLENVESRGEMTDLLKGVFSHMFGREYSWDECRKPGEGLFQELKERRA